MKNRIDMNRIPENMEWKDNQAVVLHENGWCKADMTCTTKSAKVALNRFFKAVPELAEWKEGLIESMECGCFKESDRMLADGAQNPNISYAWEIDCKNADDGNFSTVYIFLNVNEVARGGLN